MSKGSDALLSSKAWLREAASELGFKGKSLRFSDEETEKLVLAFASNKTRALEEFKGTLKKRGRLPLRGCQLHSHI